MKNLLVYYLLYVCKPKLLVIVADEISFFWGIFSGRNIVNNLNFGDLDAMVVFLRKTESNFYNGISN